MAARKEILSDLSSKIADGNIRDAYRTFEELPVVDQIAVSIAPGIGDVLAAYEVKEFGSRAKTNIEDKDYLGAAGNTGLQVLSGISLIPLFRFLRGARGVTKSATKLADAPPPQKPPTREPAQLASPKITEPELPEVEPFQPKGIQDIGYNTSQPSIQLSSKARKWVNGLHPQSPGKKVQELAPEEWVKRLVDAGIPKGELRLLRILDEANEINPKFLNETAGSKTISRGFLDDYMARSQRDAIQMRGVPKENLASPDTRFANEDLQKTQGQALYFVRGSGEYRSNPDHYSRLKYPDGTEANKSYVFDGTGVSDPRARYNLAYGFDDSSEYIKSKGISKAFDEIDLKEGDQIESIFRVQSDFQGEVADTYLPKARKARNQTADVIFSLSRIPKVYSEANTSFAQNIEFLLVQSSSQARNAKQNLRPEFLDAVAMSVKDKDAALKKYLGPDLYKTYVDDTLGNRIPGKFFAPSEKLDLEKSVSFVEYADNLFVNDLKGKGRAGYIALTPENFIDLQANPNIITEYGTGSEIENVLKEIFKRRKNIDAINSKIIAKSPTGFVEPAKQKELLKKLKNYNKQVDLVNKAVADGVAVDIDKIAASLDKDVLRFGIDKLDITPKDIEKITGKPFTESLDKSPNEIFNMTSGPLGGYQKYFNAGPRVEDRVKAYFDDIASEGTTMMELAGGVKALKKAISVNAKGLGMKIDPYFDGGSSKYMKLPVRARVLQAAKSGRDGIHIGPKQAQTEGSPTRIVQQYSSGEKEIQKILDELIPNRANQKGMISKVSGTDTEYDGTYLKFTDELKKAIEEQGIDAFKLGGPVENLSEQELAKISRSKRDEIEQELKDILGFNIYDNLFRDGYLDKLYQKYDASKDVRENIIDETESKLRESLKIPYKDEIINILQSDDPKANLEERLDVFGTKQIDRALQGLNLPIDIKKTQEGIKLGKDIYAGDKFNVDFAGYKPDDGDFRGDIDFRYKDRGRFGNIDIQSTLDELGDIDTSARYGYSKGPFDVRAVKYPGRDAMGNVSYTLSDIDVGRNQKIGVKTIVDQLKRVKFNLDYMYNNPKTGGFIDASLGLSSRGSPELNIGFGREL